MQKPYITEYFNLCGLPVIAIKTLQGELAQVWAADKTKKALRRAPEFLEDVESDSRLRPMLKEDFDLYCHKNGISSDIPERAIIQTLMLFQRHESVALTRQSGDSKINGLFLGNLALN